MSQLKTNNHVVPFRTPSDKTKAWSSPNVCTIMVESARWLGNYTTLFLHLGMHGHREGGKRGWADWCYRQFPSSHSQVWLRWKRGWSDDETWKATNCQASVVLGLELENDELRMDGLLHEEVWMWRIWRRFFLEPLRFFLHALFNFKNFGRLVVILKRKYTKKCVIWLSKWIPTHCR